MLKFKLQQKDIKNDRLKDSNKFINLESQVSGKKEAN